MKSWKVHYSWLNQFVVKCNLAVWMILPLLIIIRSQRVVKCSGLPLIWFSSLISFFFFSLLLYRYNSSADAFKSCFNHLVAFSRVSRRALSFHYTDCRSLCHSTGGLTSGPFFFYLVFLANKKGLLTFTLFLWCTCCPSTLLFSTSGLILTDRKSNSCSWVMLWKTKAVMTSNKLDNLAQMPWFFHDDKRVSFPRETTTPLKWPNLYVTAVQKSNETVASHFTLQSFLVDGLGTNHTGS